MPHAASLISATSRERERQHLESGVASSSVVRSYTASYAARVEMLTAGLDEQVLNDRAVSVLRRVKSKLAGSDFPDQASKLDVETQVRRLIAEAQSDLNLCHLYVGWCPFW